MNPIWAKQYVNIWKTIKLKSACFNFPIQGAFLLWKMFICLKTIFEPILASYLYSKSSYFCEETSRKNENKDAHLSHLSWSGICSSSLVSLLYVHTISSNRKQLVWKSIHRLQPEKHQPRPTSVSFQHAHTANNKSTSQSQLIHVLQSWASRYDRFTKVQNRQESSRHLVIYEFLWISVKPKIHNNNKTWATAPSIFEFFRKCWRISACSCCEKQNKSRENGV